MSWTRYLAQVIIIATQAVGRGIARAVREEINASRQAAANRQTSAGAGASKSAISNLKHSMTLDEAMKILNVSPELKTEDVEKRYRHLFDANDKSKGGSLYIQSKIFRAKERIDEELKIRRQSSPNDAAKPDAES